ncbi:MAG: hypothetical protein JSV86_16880 [Gemmatimonadota bacterium]|nr:MAG: hypothetical protein JSV86_16880 [Gemmatimonadota bacterium]
MKPNPGRLYFQPICDGPVTDSGLCVTAEAIELYESITRNLALIDMIPTREDYVWLRSRLSDMLTNEPDKALDPVVTALIDAINIYLE